MQERLGHVPALDGIRAVAIVAVIAYHFFRLPGGFFGVDVFFVLSGFLITTLLLEEQARSGRVSLRSFYGRRARRLLPALAAVLMLDGFFASLGGPGAMPRLEGIGVTVGYGANIYRTLGHPLPYELTQNWSLSAEEQFYLVWPTLLIFLLARRFPARRLAAVLLAAASALVLWRIVLVGLQGPSGRVFFAPDTRSDGLVLGCALAAARAAGVRLDGLRRFAPAAGLTLAAAFTIGAGSVAYMAGFPVVEAATVILIVACISGRPRLLAWRPVVAVGAISYSLYLWQGMAALFFGHTLAGVAVTFLLGWLSWRFIEQPFRRRRVPSDALPDARAAGQRDVLVVP